MSADENLQQLPAGVQDAAIKLGLWARENNLRNWKIGDVASRDECERLKAELFRLAQENDELRKHFEEARNAYQIARNDAYSAGDRVEYEQKRRESAEAELATIREEILDRRAALGNAEFVFDQYQRDLLDELIAVFSH